MQRASGQTVNRASGRRRPRTRWRPSPTTIILGVLITLAAFGSVGLALFVIWPANTATAPASSLIPTPASVYAAQLKVEKAGDPRQDGDQWLFPVKVTNNVHQPPQIKDTPTPGAPTPQPEEANVLNASVKVLIYDRPVTDPASHITGGAFGNVTDIPYGESKTFDVVATGVDKVGDWQVFPASVWTDKDPVITPEPGSHVEQPVAVTLAP